MEKATSSLKDITHHYWMVGRACRVPDAPSMSTEEALKRLQSGDFLRPESWRLKDLMHVLKFDIVEGNTKWREQNKRTESATIYQLTRSTQELTSTGSS